MRLCFITGDIANRCDYTGVGDYFDRLLSAIEKFESRENVFWAVGNHDIKRKGKIRESVIHNIRKSTDSAYEFEQAMLDGETRGVITQLGMSEYIDRHRALLGRAPAGDDFVNPHIRNTALRDLNLIILNTCLASCDDQDTFNLHIKEPGLFSAFNDLEQNKPTFVLGHHGYEFFARPSQEALSHILDSTGVDVYLCGHSHKLGYDIFNEAGRDIYQLTSGGIREDGLKFAFMHGEYDEKSQTVLIKPYSFSEGSRD